MRSPASLASRPHRRRTTTWGVVAGLAVVSLARAADAEDAAPAAAPAAEEIVVREALRVESVGRSSRSLVHTDAVEAELVAGTWHAPRSGAELELPDGTMRRWTKVSANADGGFAGDVATKGAYLSCRVPSATERVWLLHAVGHDFVYVNGELRPGDPYAAGHLRLPIVLRKGDNELLFRASRGTFRARLVAPPADVFLSAADATLPDAVRGGPDGVWSGVGAVVVVNAGPTPFRGALHAIWPAQPGAVSNRPAVVAPYSVAKLPVELPPLVVPDEPKLALRVDLVGPGDATPTPASDARPGRRLDLDVAVRAPDEVRRETYESDVDGSVQYFAVRPPTSGRALSLVLSLHGASVEALAQARAYGPRAFDAIVCPTNRRPFGFDWEDWGRWDAQDVLSLVWERTLLDPSRVYLTGHSMGGHGTWQLGVLFPDRFAAIAPSAGWRSFATYGGSGAPAPEGAVAALLARAASPSDTTAYATNLAKSAVYVLHGDADDNVPVTEAREMRRLLAPIVADLHAHEQPGAGHWWDLSDAPGADCVDWPPMWALFGRRRLPAHHEVPVVDFATPDPAVARHCFWVEVRAQERARVPSRVRIERVAGKRRFVGTTDNVRALALDVEHLGGAGEIDVVLDGTTLVCPAPALAPAVHGAEPPPIAPPVLRLERRDGAWRAVTAWTPGEKGGRVTGTFKAAFDRRFVCVVGTQGTPDEVAWAARKARCDAETWYVRGNGTTELVDDVAYAASPSTWAGRNVILYGHAEMNAAWARVVGDGPVTVTRGAVVVGDRRLEGGHLAALFVRPLKGDPDGLVGVVAGTGPAGLRLTERLPVFTSGVGLPDLVVLSPELLVQGEAGLVAAGFFGPDWSVPSGEFAFR